MAWKQFSLSRTCTLHFGAPSCLQVGDSIVTDTLVILGRGPELQGQVTLQCAVGLGRDAQGMSDLRYFQFMMNLWERNPIIIKGHVCVCSTHNPACLWGPTMAWCLKDESRYKLRGPRSGDLTISKIHANSTHTYLQGPLNMTMTPHRRIAHDAALHACYSAGCPNHPRTHPTFCVLFLRSHDQPALS